MHCFDSLYHRQRHSTRFLHSFTSLTADIELGLCLRHTLVAVKSTSRIADPLHILIICPAALRSLRVCYRQTPCSVFRSTLSMPDSCRIDVSSKPSPRTILNQPLALSEPTSRLPPVFSPPHHGILALRWRQEESTEHYECV